MKTAKIADSAELSALMRQLQLPEQRRLRLALLMALSNVLLLIVQYGLLAWLVNHWLQASLHNNSPDMAANILILVIFGLAICLFLRPLLQHARERLSLRASLNIRSQLRQRVLQRLASPAAQLGHSTSDGALASRVLDQVDALDGYLQRYVVQSRLAILVPLLLLTAIAPFSLLAAGLMLLTAPLVPLFMIILGKAASSSSRRQMQALSRLSGRFLDLVRGMRTLQQLQATTQAEQEIAAAAASYRQRTMGVLRMAFLSGAVLEFFASLSIALVAVYLGLGLLGILPWAKEEIPVPYASALFILLLAPEFYAPLRQLGNDYHAKADAEAVLQELKPLLDDIYWQHPGQQPVELETAPAILLQDITVQDSSGRQRLQLEQLELSAGNSILIQGSSGAGKSTLLQILLGALPYQGQIKINQQNFTELKLSGWLDKLDYLAQQPRFIEGTLADNLLLAAPTASKTQMLQAMQQVGLDKLVAERGLDCQLGERGAGLSGGQLGRLALARLLLRNRPLWLLDEPTVHLDPDSRNQIHQLLQKLSTGRTLLMVSHTGTGLDWVNQQLHLHSVEAPNQTNKESAYAKQ